MRRGKGSWFIFFSFFFLEGDRFCFTGTTPFRLMCDENRARFSCAFLSVLGFSFSLSFILFFFNLPPSPFFLPFVPPFKSHLHRSRGRREYDIIFLFSDLLVRVGFIISATGQVRLVLIWWWYITREPFCSGISRTRSMALMIQHLRVSFFFILLFSTSEEAP